MPLNTPANTAGLFIGLAITIAMAVPFFYVMWLTERRHRKNMQALYEQRRAMHEKFLNEIDRLQAQDQNIRATAAVLMQTSVSPTITVPITYCERRERRRRFLPLEEGNNNASG
jgi:uncharacterized membrane protein (DUF106 family)